MTSETMIFSLSKKPLAQGGDKGADAKKWHTTPKASTVFLNAYIVVSPVYFGNLDYFEFYKQIRL